MAPLNGVVGAELPTMANSHWFAVISVSFDCIGIPANAGLGAVRACSLTISIGYVLQEQLQYKSMIQSAELGLFAVPF